MSRRKKQLLQSYESFFQSETDAPSIHVRCWLSKDYGHVNALNKVNMSCSGTGADAV
jgi:hypothetical protein